MNPELAALLHQEFRMKVAACIDHDLSGPAAAGYVFATCSKCRGRFKVKIEEAA